jgi:hypothetical protein
MRARGVRVSLTPTTTGGRVKLECSGDGKIFREATEIAVLGNLGLAAAAWVNKTLRELGFEVDDAPEVVRSTQNPMTKISTGLRD